MTDKDVYSITLVFPWIHCFCFRGSEILFLCVTLLIRANLYVQLAAAPKNKGGVLLPGRLYDSRTSRQLPVNNEDEEEMLERKGNRLERDRKSVV